MVNDQSLAVMKVLSVEQWHITLLSITAINVLLEFTLFLTLGLESAIALNIGLSESSDSTA